MKTITSPDNALYKLLKSLHAAKGRAEHRLFLAEGPHLAEEAVKSGKPVRFLAVRDDSLARHAALLRACEGAGAEALALSPRLFDALAGTESPQGILAAVEYRETGLIEHDMRHDTLAIVLDRVQDPGNVGTMLRTALAVGAGFAVLTADSADPWSPKVARASQGAVLHLPILTCGTAAEAVDALNARGWHTACGVLGGSDFFARERHARTAIVIGNEAAGVSAEAAAACAARWSLPMPGKAESLNAAVAAGVMLYELWREQNGSSVK